MENLTQNSTILNKSESEHCLECRNDMAQHGLTLDGDIVFDGKIHRYSADEKPLKKDEWYIASIDEEGNAHIYYASYSTDERFQFSSWNGRQDMPDEEKRKYQYRMRELAKQKHAAQELEVHKATAQKLEDEYNNLATIGDGEVLEYPNKKGIKPIGIKVLINQGFKIPVIPLRDTDHLIWSLQTIYPNFKKFAPASKTIGVFHVINDEQLEDYSTIYVCEGWATGVSIYEAIKTKSTFVVAAMSKHNISHTIENIKKKYYHCQYIIACDADKVGKEAAEKVAQRFGTKVAYPDCTIGKDFNDVHKQYGLYTVKQQLEKTVLFESNLEAAKRLAERLMKKEDPCVDFNLNNMPPILKEHVLELCCANSAHPLVVLSSLLVGASAAIGKRFIIEKDFDKTEGYFGRLYCNMWVLSLAPSGQFKSTALNLGARYVQEHRKMVHKYTEELKKQLSMVSESQQEEIKEQIQQMDATNILLPDRVTPAALLQLLGQGRGGAIFNSEFGGFLKELTHSNNTGLMALLTKFFDCDPLTEDTTKTQGSNFIERPYISINGVSTVAWIGSGFSDEDIHGGFGARFLLFLLPKTNERPPSLPSRKYIAQENTYDAYRDALKTLPASRRYRITQEAAEYYDVVYNKIYDLKESFDEEGGAILDPFLRRWCPYILKISMIMQYFFNKHADRIGVDAIKAASDFVYPAIKSTVSLFRDELGESKFEKDCNKIFNWICSQVKENGQPVSHQKLNHSKCVSSLVPKERDDIIKILDESGRIKVNRDKTGSKSKTTYEII
jgi:putative DNA primase/helicase